VANKTQYFEVVFAELEGVSQEGDNVRADDREVQLIIHLRLRPAFLFRFLQSKPYNFFFQTPSPGMLLTCMQKVSTLKPPIKHVHFCALSFFFFHGY